MLVAEVALVPGAEEAVSARSVVVADVASVAALVTCSGMELPVGMDCSVVVAEVFGLEVCSDVERTFVVVSNGEVPALVEEDGGVDSGSDVVCAAEVENSVVMEVRPVVGSEVEVDVAAEVEVVSNVVVILVGVLRVVEVVSRVELSEREEVLAEDWLVPGEADDVCVGTTEVAVVSAASVVIL